MKPAVVYDRFTNEPLERAEELERQREKPLRHAAAFKIGVPTALGVVAGTQPLRHAAASFTTVVSTAMASLGAAVREGLRKAVELEQARVKEALLHPNCRSMTVAVKGPTHPDFISLKQQLTEQWERAAKNAGLRPVAQFHDETVLGPAKECVLDTARDEEGISFLQEQPSGLPNWTVGSFLDGL